MKGQVIHVVAQVIVNHNSKEVDKLFDYLIPPALEPEISVGSRILVPFGRGNRQLEAYVFKLCEKSKTKNLKPVLSVVEGGPVFDEKMLKLIYWMRERYLCSFIDILHVIVPAGISVKPEEWIVLNEKQASVQSEVKKKILEIIRENGGACEINYFMQFFENNIRTQISQLCASGILKKEYRDNNRVRDKIVRVAALAIDEDDVFDIIEGLNKRRAFAQAKMLEILIGNEFIAVSDLVRFADGSYNAVSSLEKKGLITLNNITVLREILSCEVTSKTEPPLYTEEQQKAVSQLKILIEKGEYSRVLLHGVTGSGKTEVFMNAISEVIKKGKQAILLVPEIALTPQMVQRFTDRFGSRIAVFHSGLSLGEKYDQWKKMRDGEADIVIGARSAVFAPFSNLGIIIMDEEHEQTYKSEMTPRYQTKEVAVFRAAQDQSVLLLASATPEVQSYYKASVGEYQLLEMKQRANRAQMPEVAVVDMRDELESGNKSIFSRLLTEEIGKNLACGEQTILFLNRRGFSTFVSCRSCGYVAKCPDCNISLTYHKFNDQLRCHYCGYTRSNPTECPSCGGKYIRYFGSGTQKIEEEIQKLFPEASTIRMDVDTTGRKFAHEKILNEFEKKKIDILIGTQMVAKGLDFENVTLVGVVSADVMLNLDDYRSGERSFSVLEQVTGRAGRAKKPGRAVVQTYSPEHTAITYMQRHDYHAFYRAEIQMREAMWYPPFCDMILVMFSALSETLVQQASKFFAKQLSAAGELPQKVRILGPIPSAVTKIKNKYRWQLVIKCDNADALNVILTEAQLACLHNPIYSRVSVVIDKNPNGIL